MSIQSHYIELILRQDNNKNKNQPIKIEELYQEKDSSVSNTKMILIRGDPGSGKSTLMTKLAFCWAK